MCECEDQAVHVGVREARDSTDIFVQLFELRARAQTAEESVVELAASTGRMGKLQM